MDKRLSFSLALWLVTIFLIALIIGTVKAYEAKGNFPSADKATFNVLMLIWVYLLEVSFLKGFVELVKALKPTLSHWANGDTEEAPLPQTAESLWSIVKLWWISCRKSTSKLAVFCAAWISLITIAGLVVAATSLTLTVNDGKDYNDTYVTHGIVDVANLSCYFGEFSQRSCASQVTTQTVSHSYGEMILAFESDSGSYNDFAKILRYKRLYRYFHRKTPDQRQVAYRFNEYNPNDTLKVYPYLTDRIITAEARNCITYDQIDGDNEDPQTFTYVNKVNASDKGTITIPRKYLGREGTTYIYLGFHDPTMAHLQSCGPRCLYMWAYKNPSGIPAENPEAPAFYKCAVNISEVYHSSRPEHMVPDSVAKMSAASIVLQGQYAGPSGNRSKQDYHWYRFYASGSPWEIHDPSIASASYVGDRFALFALGSLANMATLNPVIQIPGNLTHLGHSIVTYEPWFTIVWSCIAVAHLGVLVAVGVLVGFGRIEDQQMEMGPVGGSNAALVREDGIPDRDASEDSERRSMDTQESVVIAQSVHGEQGTATAHFI